MTYRRRNGTTATAAAHGFARWLLHLFLLLPRQLLLFFFLPLASGLTLSLAALDFPLVSFDFSWFFFPLLFLCFSLIFLCFSFSFLYFLSSLLAEMDKWADQLLLPSIMDVQLVAQVVKILIFDDIMHNNALQDKNITFGSYTLLSYSIFDTSRFPCS